MIHSVLETYTQRLDDLRDQDTALLARKPREALIWRPIEGQAEHTNSFAALAAPAAGPEHWNAEVTGSTKTITAFRETLTRLLEENVK